MLAAEPRGRQASGGNPAAITRRMSADREAGCGCLTETSAWVMFLCEHIGRLDLIDKNLVDGLLSSVHGSVAEPEVTKRFTPEYCAGHTAKEIF